MDYQQFASDLRGQTIAFSSIEENEETMAVFDVDQRLRQLGKGRFRSHLALRTMGETEFFADRFSTSLSLHVAPPSGSVGFLFPRSISGRFLALGENIGEDKLVFVTDRSGADVVVPALAGSEDVAIPMSSFPDRMAALCPTIDVPEHATIYEGDPAKLRAIRQNIVEIVSTENEPYSEEAVSNLIDATIAWLGESAPYWGPESLTIDPERRRVAKKAQEYIEDHYDECVRIEDLCKETGVGVRTLQRSFREYFDVTISEYLKSKRLDEAHRDLGHAHPTSSTVTEIALQHGFSHLGRFSVDFKERFGESPRTTLATQESRKSAVREIPASVFLATGRVRRRYQSSAKLRIK